jgi:alpha-N-arabinofuranosidase
MLIGEKGEATGEMAVSGFTNEWKQYLLVLRATGTQNKAHLKLVLSGTGTVDRDVISLFPQDIRNHRPNGLLPPTWCNC